jgi:hypothetical protein
MSTETVINYPHYRKKVSDLSKGDNILNKYGAVVHTVHALFPGEKKGQLMIVFADGSITDMKAGESVTVICPERTGDEILSYIETYTDNLKVVVSQGGKLADRAKIKLDAIENSTVEAAQYAALIAMNTNPDAKPFK